MNENLIVVFTGVVAAATFIYTLITGWLVLETRKMRLAQFEPRVSVQLELDKLVGHGGFQLAIRNEGMGPAHEIEFDFSGKPTYFVKNGAGKPIDEMPVIKEGIRYLGPGQDFTFTLGWLFGDDFKQAMKQPWIFEVSYRSAIGKRRKDKYVLDFSQFEHLIVGSGDPLRNIEKHLDSIRKELNYWGTGFHKIRVIIEPTHDFGHRQPGEDVDEGSTTKEEWLANIEGLPVSVVFQESSELDPDQDGQTTDV